MDNRTFILLWILVTLCLNLSQVSSSHSDNNNGKFVLIANNSLCIKYLILKIK